MAKPKGQALQQRFGFMDDDLKKPAHDDMMLWLNKHAVAITGQLFRPPDWPPKEIDMWKQRLATAIDKARKECRERRVAVAKATGYAGIEAKRGLERCEELLTSLEQWAGLGTTPPRPEWEIISQKWEQAITNRDFIIGFVDLVVTYRDANLQLDGLRQVGVSEWEMNETEEEFRLPKWKVGGWETYQVYFEVKTEIPSLGELIRQINMYREYLKGKFVVVSPDDRFVELLREQDIYFYKYDSSPKQNF